MTWNGVAVTDPVLIFWDEIPLAHHSTGTLGNVNSRGALVCRSDEGRPEWRISTGDRIPFIPSNGPSSFMQVRTGQNERPGITRLYRGRSIANFPDPDGIHLNAVIRCVLDGVDSSFVTLVNREQG